jgi:hypothetical protein
LSDLLEPRIGSRRHRVPTLGAQVAEIAEQLGMAFFPWQRHRADVSYELAKCPAGRRLAAGTALTIAGRQTGKTAAVTADVAFRCLAPQLPAVAAAVGHPVGPQHVAFTAQDRIGALGRWYEHVEMIMASPLGALVAKVVRKNGEECVHWCNGSKYRVVTPSKTGARGLSLDVVVIDEALAHEPWLLDAIAPTMAQRDGASVSFGAQLVIVSNAGDETAELLAAQRELGRRAVAEDDRGRVHLEWSCADDADPLDPVVWAQTIPTLDRPDGLSSAFLARQAETMGTDAFAREYLCRTVWSQNRRVIAPDEWADLPHVVLHPSPQAVLGVEVAPDRSSAVVVAACATGEHVGVELVDQRPGVDWVVERVTELTARTRCRVVIDRYGPASPLATALDLAGVKVLAVSSHDVADAAAGLVDAVAARRVGHVGDIRFQDAVSVLGRRQRGDRWVFDRHGGDVSAIVAASLAVWAVDTKPARIPAIH